MGETMGETRALVLSIDAMTGEDLEAARGLAHFSRLLKKGALARRVRAAYPSLTYPCHAAMVTGCWPERTHVVNNEVFVPDSLHRPWVFTADQIGTHTIFDAAKAAGVSTGCVMWPCMGRAPIDTLIPEIWGAPGEGFLAPMCRVGSAAYIRAIWPDVGAIPNGFAQPQFDAFAVACARHVILDRAPRLMYVHICGLDDCKHYHGLSAPHIMDALRRTDAHIGQLLDALDRAGVGEATNVVLCSDHGQLPVDRGSWPNRCLRGLGLMERAPDGHLGDWTVQCHSACLSAQVYARGPQGEAAARRVFLDEAVQRQLGIERVLTKEEALREYHLAGEFCLVLEAAPGVQFFDDVQGDALMAPLHEADIAYKANHGHDPAKGEQPFFLIAGPAARPGARVEAARLIDEPVTVAAMMGFALPWAQGVALRDLLK